jgi:copper chaperone NosL
MKQIKMQNLISQIIIACVIIVLLTSCETKTEVIKYGQDECSFCTMKINDDKYSAKIATSEGELYKFDSIECLADFAMVKNYVDDTGQSFMISDYNSPGIFIDARNSMYVHNNNFPSPMGLNVMAFDSQELADKFMKENGGELMIWNDIIDLVRKRSE